MENDESHKSLFAKCVGMLLEPVPANLNAEMAEELYSNAREKTLGANSEQDFIDSHELIERVLELEGISIELRGLALIFSAMNYIDGRGVKADPQRALKNLIECDKIGHEEGAFNLGLFFEGRFGKIYPISKDFNLAAFFYSRSIRMGSVYAITNLGLLHVGGYLSVSNKDLGWYLLRYAEMKGDIVATEAICKLSKRF